MTRKNDTSQTGCFDCQAYSLFMFFHDHVDQQSSNAYHFTMGNIHVNEYNRNKNPEKNKEMETQFQQIKSRIWYNNHYSQ